MIRIICLTLIVFAFSCSKKTTKEPPVGSVSFSANGTSYSWKEQNSQNASNANTYLTMYIYSASGNYYLNVSNALSNWLIPGKEIFLTLNTNTLTTNTPFTLTNTVGGYPYPHYIVIYPSTVYDATYVYNASSIGDFATVTITGINNGRADGNFSARLTRVSDGATINITNGIFKNVEIMP